MTREHGMNPRLLLVEDDAVSRQFLAEGARGLPAIVDIAVDAAEAIALAGRYRHDIWMIDARLPDASGAGLLQRLRGLHATHRPPALGHTASRLPADLDALRDAGFDAVVAKPLTVAAWQAAIRDLLQRGVESHWDDALALRTLHGNASGMVALRGLFREELPRQQRDIRAALATGDSAAAREELHRLKASCGFVGAARLRGIVERLHAAPGDDRARGDFDAETAALLAESPTPRD